MILIHLVAMNQSELRRRIDCAVELLTRRTLVQFWCYHQSHRFVVHGDHYVIGWILDK